MKKPPIPCDYSAPGSHHIRHALDGLTHFHVEHTGRSGVTVWTKGVATEAADGTPENRHVMVCVASDPVLIRQIEELLKPHLAGVILDDNDAPPQPPPPKVIH